MLSHAGLEELWRLLEVLFLKNNSKKKQSQSQQNMIIFKRQSGVKKN